MLYGEKSKKELDKHAEEQFKKILKASDKRKLYDEVQDKFGLDYDRIDQMITFKRNIKEFTPFEIFAVMWFIDQDCLGNYFTENEIKFLSKEKAENIKVSFPIDFDQMVEISQDQWIGKTTVRRLMELKSSHLINYEEGEQRGYQRMKSGSLEIWRPFVSNRNVAEIKAALQSGDYIPDPITLNMPEGAEFTFSDGTLSVLSLPKGMFNLDDGYHRYLAMSQIYDFDPAFDYPMELRIVNFSNSKANRFIYQQDQKTPMRKIVSDSMNPDAAANKVVNFLKQDSGCYVSSMIGRNGAAINEAVLSKLVNHFFVDNDYKRGKKEGEMQHVMSIKNQLKEKFNALAGQDAKFLERYSDQQLFAAMYVFAADISPDQYAAKVTAILSRLSEEDKDLMNVSKYGGVRRKAITALNSIWEVVSR